jgi:glycosyltransferase involved in cell wall biosynthesis
VKILHVSTYTYPDCLGGAERTVDGMARAQARRGHAVTLLVGGAPDAPAASEREGVRVLRYPITAKRGLGFFREVRKGVREAMRQLAREGFDVLHAHQLASASPALTATFPARRVYSFHASYRLESEAAQLNGAPATSAAQLSRRAHAKSLLIDHVDRECLARAERILVHTRFVHAQVERLDRAALGRVRVVPPGIDLDRFRPDEAARAAARSVLGVASGPPLIVTARRLVRRVGIDLLLEALAILRGKGIAFAAIVAGDGAERPALERLRTELGLESQVAFHGRVSDAELVERYRAADVFALPTRSLEGFGLATLEALACGTPVVATDVGATPELIDAVGGGLLARPEPAELAERLMQALADPQAMRRAANEASRRVHERYTWSARAADLDQVYRELLPLELPERVMAVATGGRSF